MLITSAPAGVLLLISVPSSYSADLSALAILDNEAAR